MDQSYHHAVMARAIEAIDARKGDPLTLPEIASELGMSPAHFQRLFSAWVGVSPKRYHQYLALGQAREMLRARFTTLETAQEVGLSGAGRLHDLFVRWEAMTPGEFAAGGPVPIRWGWFDSPYGPALAMATDRGLCGMGFAGPMDREETFADLARRWPSATFIEDAAAVAPVARPALEGRGETRLQMIGAPFQIKVWEALLRVPEGHVTTYSEIARAIDNPRAVRAVGTAVGRNPVSLAIPCHRALRASGALGGYHWGLPVKRAILAREAARADARQPLSGPDI